MRTQRRIRPLSLLRRLAAQAAVSLLAWQGSVVSGQEAVPPPLAEAKAPADASPARADLAHLRALALERQPALHAHRASLAAAEHGRQGLDDLCVPTFLRRDLPYRRAQASRGVISAQALVEKTEWETRYSVTRLYLSAIYAQEQLTTVTATLEDPDLGIIFLRDVVDAIEKSNSRRDVKKWNVLRLESLIENLKARREEAVSGKARALAALREAVGLEPGTCLTVAKDAKLPELKVTVPCKDEVVRLALERRPEMVQVSMGIEVTGLEVKAQQSRRGPTSETFAIGSDIHAQSLPTSDFGPNYRPGAVGIEMPPQLTGPKEDRVARAGALHDRAHAVAEKTRQLIALEAEDAWIRWNEASRQVEALERAVKKAEQVAEAVGKSFNSAPDNKEPVRPTVEDLTESKTELALLRVRLAQARLEVLLGLAALERVTAGGVCPGFDH